MRRFGTRSFDSNQFRRFIVAGVLNTLFGFAVYSTAIIAGLPVWGALVVGNLAGIGFNFLTTGGYVFRSLFLSNLPKFAGAYLLTYVVNLLLHRGLSHWIGNSIYAQALLVVPMAIFAFVLMKIFVFTTAEKA